MDIGEVRVLFGWAINYVLGSISGVNIVSCIWSGRALEGSQAIVAWVVFLPCLGYKKFQKYV